MEEKESDSCQAVSNYFSELYSGDCSSGSDLRLESFSDNVPDEVLFPVNDRDVRPSCDNEWKNLARNIYQRVKTVCRQDYIFHTDIIAEGGFREVYRLKQQSSTNCKRDDIIIGIIYHPEGEETEDRGHIHVYHDCPYTSRTCRCGFLRGFRVKRRRHRHNATVNSTNSIDYWYKWVQYYTKEPRRCIYMEVGGMDFCGEIHRIKGLEQSGSTTPEKTDGMVERSCLLCEESSDNSSYFRENPAKDRESIERIASHTAKRSEQVSRSLFKPSSELVKKQYNHAQLLEIMKNFLCVPFESSCHLVQWVSDPYLAMFDSRNLQYQLAVNVLLRLTANLPYPEILKLHKNAKTPVYYSRSPDHYLPIDKSIDIINQLLAHQFNNNQEIIQEFITTLYNILERRLPKMNSVYLVGPASSGKTYFVMMVCAFYLNVGHVKNFVRGQNFPLNDCGNRRVLIWNEPSIMPSAFDTVKMLSGGDPCPAAVKYQGDTTIPKTPLLFTANRMVVSSKDPVWNSRISFYKWTSAPLLAGIHGYPHPLTWEFLINKYVNNM